MYDDDIKVGDRLLTIIDNEYVFGIVVSVMLNNNAFENGPKKHGGFCQVEWMSTDHSLSDIQGMYSARLFRANYKKAVEDGVC